MLGFLMIYGVGCVFAAIFVFLVLKETAGKSIDDVGVNEKVKNTTSADEFPTKV